MILYGLKNCDTCRKAMKSLKDIEFVDVRQDGIPKDVLKTAHEALGDVLLNSRSTTWRGLSETERQAAPIDLLMAHPALMKRPLIEKDGTYYLGWGKDVQDALLG